MSTKTGNMRMQRRQKHKKKPKRVANAINPEFVNLNARVADKKFFVHGLDEGQKKAIYKKTARFYSMPVQMGLVIWGTPFHLISDQFVRFHALQSTVIGWKFIIIYILLLTGAFANILFFSGEYADILLWIFIFALFLQAIINTYLIWQTAKGKECALPIMGDIAKRIAMAG
ncbi:MAG: hypothetical protein WC492_02950 [Candidatus Micrarchaeia archaeon]